MKLTFSEDFTVNIERLLDLLTMRSGPLMMGQAPTMAELALTMAEPVRLFNQHLAGCQSVITDVAMRL